MFEQVAPWPWCRASARTLNYDVGLAQVLEQIVGDHPEHSQHHHGLVQRAPSAVVLAKLHIESPVAVILDAPMLPNQHQQLPRRQHPGRGVGHEIAELRAWRQLHFPTNDNYVSPVVVEPTLGPIPFFRLFFAGAAAGRLFYDQDLA